MLPMLRRFYYVYYFPRHTIVPSGPVCPHIEASRSLSATHHTTQRPLPGNTQHSQETESHAPVGFEPAFPASDWPQTHALGSAATGISK